MDEIIEINPPDSTFSRCTCCFGDSNLSAVVLGSRAPLWRTQSIVMCEKCLTQLKCTIDFVLNGR